MSRITAVFDASRERTIAHSRVVRNAVAEPSRPNDAWAALALAGTKAYPTEAVEIAAERHSRREVQRIASAARNFPPALGLRLTAGGAERAT
jgi:hypothetical protein